MSGKEVPRAGLVKAALAGRITNQQGATALHLSLQRLKRRVAAEGACLVHRNRGRARRKGAERRSQRHWTLRLFDALCPI